MFGFLYGYDFSNASRWAPKEILQVFNLWPVLTEFSFCISFSTFLVIFDASIRSSGQKYYLFYPKKKKHSTFLIKYCNYTYSIGWIGINQHNPNNSNPFIPLFLEHNQKCQVNQQGPEFQWFPSKWMDKIKCSKEPMMQLALPDVSLCFINVSLALAFLPGLSTGRVGDSDLNLINLIYMDLGYTLSPYKTWIQFRPHSKLIYTPK